MRTTGKKLCSSHKIHRISSSLNGPIAQQFSSSILTASRCWTDYKLTGDWMTRIYSDAMMLFACFLPKVRGIIYLKTFRET